MEKKFIQDFKVGARLEGAYQLKKKELANTKDGKPYLKLTLSDKTGSIDARMWDDAESAFANVETGSAVVIRGIVESYRENTQVKVEAIRSASENEYTAADLMRTVANRDELLAGIGKILDRVRNKYIALLARKFLDDKEFMEKFRNSPAASSWHNAYIGGLLEHTYDIMVIVARACDLYPEANRDIAVIGAFLHDIGKTMELDPKSFEYTVSGGLMGHLPLGFEMLAKSIASIDGFPEDLALQLKHIVLSHHGEYEQQSPVLPKTLEATIIYHADALVSQANAVKEIIRSQGPSGKDWSNFVNIKNRKYFLKRPEEA